MTVTSAETTNVFAAEEKVAGWLNAYHLNLLRSTQDDIEGFRNETLTMFQREAIAQGDLIARALVSANEQRRETVRTLVDRLKAHSAGHPDVPTTRVAGMEKWEGRVLEVDEDYFTVELVPFVEGGAEVLADFSTDLLSEDDDVQAGDVVYVTVRTVVDVRGPHRTSAVRLRRLGRWTETEVAEQRERGRKRLSELALRFD